MEQLKIQIGVRSPAEGIRILDIQGGISGGADEVLFAAYNAASNDARAIILNLSEVPAIDSLGAGLLIALLARVRKQGQRLLAYGLSEHCRRAFELTYLEEMVGLARDEAEAIGSI